MKSFTLGSLRFTDQFLLARLGRSLIFGLFFVFGTLGLRAAVTWQKVVTPQFTLYSSGKSADALQVAEEFQQFIGALSERIRVDARALPPLTIVMFDREKEFRPFRPKRPDGKASEVAGFFSRHDGWSVFGLAGTRIEEQVRRIVFHEGVHWFLSGSDEANPTWLSEGLAEVFSTFAVNKGRREWGQPIDVHLRVLNTTKPLPLEKLMAVSRTDPLFNENQRIGLFYAQSWAFVHYLLFGEHNRDRTLFNDYMKASRSGMHPDEAFKTVFKKDYAGMDRELRTYFSGGKYYVGSRPLSAAASTLKVEPIVGAEREIALARLALGSFQLELAQTYIEAALRLAPDSAAANEVAGYAASARGDEAGVAAFFGKAAQYGSKDYRVYYEPAQRQHQAGNMLAGGVEISMNEARQIANGYERALNLRPRFLAAYQGLAGIIELLGPDNAEDRKFLEIGRKRFPDDSMILLGLAAASQQSGVEDEARQLLAAVVAKAETNPTAVNGYAQRLDETWRFNKSTNQVRLMVEAQNYEEALVALDELLAQGVPNASRATLAVNRANIVAGVRMGQAQKAWEAQQWSEARKLLQEILASPVQTGFKLQARSRIAELDRLNLGRN